MSDELPTLEDALYNAQQVSESRRKKIAELERQRDELLACVQGFERKLETYVGVFDDDKELRRLLNECRIALAKVKS